MNIDICIIHTLKHHKNTSVQSLPCVSSLSYIVRACVRVCELQKEYRATCKIKNFASKGRHRGKKKEPQASMCNINVTSCQSFSKKPGSFAAVRQVSRGDDCQLLRFSHLLFVLRTCQIRRRGTS